MSVPYPRSAGDGGPEEAPPVGILEDVGQDAGEQARAVQHGLALLLRGAAGVCSPDQPLHRLGKNQHKYRANMSWNNQDRQKSTLIYSPEVPVLPVNHHFI